MKTICVPGAELKDVGCPMQWGSGLLGACLSSLGLAGLEGSVESHCGT